MIAEATTHDNLQPNGLRADELRPDDHNGAQLEEPQKNSTSTATTSIYNKSSSEPTSKASSKREESQSTKESSIATDDETKKFAKLNLSHPVSRSIGKKLRQAMKEKEDKKRSKHPASFRGWKEVSGYDKSYKLSPVDEIMDLLTRATTLEQYLPEALYGDWYHGIAVTILASFLSWLAGRFKYGLGIIFFITFSSAMYYRSSIRKYRLGLRLEAQREFSVHAIEDDFESTDWLNVLLQKYWVYLEPSISQQITDIVNPMIAELDTIPAFIKEVWIHSMTLGTKPPRVDQVRTLERTGDDVTVMDWTVSMIPNALEDSTAKQMKNKVNQEVIVKAKLFGMTIPILVSDISFRVNARVRLRMMTKFPHIQTVNVSLDNVPDFDFKCKPVGDDSFFGIELLNIPGVYLLIREMVKKYVGPILFEPLSFQLNLEQLLAGNGATGALGVLELNIKNATGLQAADTFNNTIDPYFTFGFSGTVLAQTKIVNDTTDPVYNETIRVILSSSADPLAIMLYDENISDGRKDKFMGAALYDLEELMSKGEINDISLPILRNNYPAGTFNFDIKLMKSLQGSKLPDGSYSAPPDCNTGVATFNLGGLRAYKELDKTKLSLYAEIYVDGKKECQSPVAKNATSAKWNVCFENIIYDRAKCKIHIILREKSKENKIHSTAILRLVDIIDASYVGNSWFPVSSGLGEVKLSCNWNSVRIPGVPGAIGYSKPVGVLRVYIEKADDLINLEKIGVIDPYVRVLVNGLQRGRTVTLDSTVNPKYYESIYIPISSINQRITIEAMDVERHTQDRTLGSFQVRLNEFIDFDTKGEPIQTTGDVTEAVLFHKRRGAKGSVSYSVSYYPILPVATAKEIETEEEENKKLQEKIDETEAKEKAKKAKSNDKRETGEDHKGFDKKELLSDESSSKVELKKSELSDYNTGVIVLTVLESKFSTGGYLQIFFDKQGHAAHEAKISLNRSMRFTFDYFIKELVKFSLVTIRIVEKPDANFKKPALKEFTTSTFELLKNTYDNAQTVNIGDNANWIKLETKFLPAVFDHLPPADSIGNSGTLSLEILDAYELLSKDSNGKSDPFCKVYLNGKECYKTKTKKKTLEPQWNESTTIEINSRVQSALRFKVSDWDFGLEQDDVIGNYNFLLKSIDPFNEDYQEHKFELLTPDRSYAGTLNVRMRFKPEYHTIVSAEKQLPNASSLAVDGAGKILGTGVDGAGKILGTGVDGAGKVLKIGTKAVGTVGGIFKKKK